MAEPVGRGLSNAEISALLYMSVLTVKIHVGRLIHLVPTTTIDRTDEDWAWSELTQNRERSNYELNALASGFWSSGSPEDLRPYAARYVSDIPHLAQWVGADALDRVATLAFPAPVVETETVELVREA